VDPESQGFIKLHDEHLVSEVRLVINIYKGVIGEIASIKHFENIEDEERLD